MKKKRRLALFVTNLVAAGIAASSAWLQWWDGAWPATTDFTQLLKSINVGLTVPFSLSVAIMIFVVASLMLFSALTAWKIFSFLGAILGCGIITLWFIHSGMSIDFTDFNFNQINVGVLVMASAVLLSLIAIIIPKRREKLK